MTSKRRPIDYKSYRTSQYLTCALVELSVRNKWGSIVTIRGNCPLCRAGGLQGRTFSVSKNGECWYCHACCRGGDSVTLVTLVTGMEPYESCIWLSEKTSTPIHFLIPSRV